MTTKADLRAQIRDLLEEREDLLTEIRRLRMGNHPAGKGLRTLSVVQTADEYEGDWSAAVALGKALTERDAEHEGGEGA